jgi:hypothetical protein
MRKILVLAGLIAALTACGAQSISDDQHTVDKQQQQYAKVQPVPFYDWSQDRAALIQIYTAKNEQRQTYAVITAQGTGAAIFSCPAIGYPLPADTQLTNGLQWIGSGGAVVEQAEPNGLYSSKNTDATYVLCLRDDGKIVPVYTEQKVTLFPFPVKVENGQITDIGGAATITVDLSKPK